MPSVASDDEGDFVIAWTGEGQDGSSTGVFAQRFASDGSFAGTEFQVNSYTPLNQSAPSVGSDDSGDLLVVWSSEKQDGSYSGVSGQRFDSDGNRPAASSR